MESTRWQVKLVRVKSGSVGRPSSRHGKDWEPIDDPRGSWEPFTAVQTPDGKWHTMWRRLLVRVK